MSAAAIPRAHHLHRPQFTLIELLVVIAIVAILAAMLLPALARARGAAIRSDCMAGQRQLYLGVVDYSITFDDFGPGNFAINGADWSNRKNPMAGSQIWGCEKGTVVANTNIPLGLGMLKTESIIEDLELMWCPVERFAADLQNGGTYVTKRFSSYYQKDYFGLSYQTPYTDPKSGLPWVSWFGSANYYIQSSYMYRGGDWTTSSTQNRSLGNLRTSHDNYPYHVLIADFRAVLHQQPYGCNTVAGDGSSLWVADDGYDLILATSSSGPVYPGVAGGASANGYLLTGLGAALDKRIW